MDNWIVGQVSFWYTVNKIKPAQIVDYCINLFLNLTIPGRGAGENHWLMRGVRTVQQSAERTNREMDIRLQLRQWDHDFPEIHHELIVRWLFGAVVSLGITAIYQGLKPQARQNRKN
jgi:hypothetical protein